jgi:hypothetical protein
MESIVIQCNKNALLSSPAIPLFLTNVSEFGGALEALVYQQIGFLSKQIFHGGKNIKAARVSYTRLQKYVPTATRRTIIKVIADLKNCGAIFVYRTKRVNLLSINSEYQFKTKNDDKADAAMLVFPALLMKLTLLETIALQQIHMRCKGFDGSFWMISTCNQLQCQIFPFVSLTTVSRLVASLRQKGLIYVKPYVTEDGVVNSYRVNYHKLAELLDLPIQEAIPPKSNKFVKWINPVFPLGHPQPVA